MNITSISPPLLFQDVRLKKSSVNSKFPFPLVKTVAMKEPSDRIVVARTLHRETNSYLLSIFKRTKVTITLRSDGTIVSNRKDPLAGTDEGIDLNGAKIQYFFPHDKGKTVFRLMAFLSFMASINFAIGTISMDGKTVLTEFTLNHTIAILSFLFWGSWDIARSKLLTQEHLLVKTITNKEIKISGNLPSQGVHKASAGIILFCLILVGFLATPEGSLSEDMFSLFVIAYAILGIPNYMDWLTASKDYVASHSTTHFYFAIMNILQSDYDLHQPRDEDEMEEFNKVKVKLEQYQSLLDDVASSKEIFASKSPSLIVIAIGATTERLMKKACDSLGIKRKTNARPTLHTFIHEYQTKKPLDDKSLTQLNVIKEFRNRATHHFNIDWDESFIVLSQFCQFVEWYAETHALTE